MASKPNAFLEYLANKNGTGIAAKVNENGNHYLVQSVIDDYATNGEVVPSDVQAQLKELNDIVRQESLLGNASAGARTSLAGAGYSAMGNLNRVNELEQNILTKSAAARTAKSRAELQTAQSLAQINQLEARMKAETFDARREAEVAQNYFSAAQNRANTSIHEKGAATKKVVERMDTMGATADEYSAAYMSNDPATLQNYFGTTDRVAISDAISARRISDNSVMQGQLDAVTRTRTAQVRQLTEDEGVKTEDLAAMLSGKVSIPEGLSTQVISETLAARQKLETAAYDYLKTSADQAVSEDEIQAKLLARIPDGQLAAMLMQHLGMDGPAIQEALRSDKFEQMVMDLATNPAVANSTAMVPVTGPDGRTMQVPLVKLRDILYENVSNNYIGMASAAQANTTFTKFAMEQTEVQRQLDVTKAIMPFGVDKVTEIAVQEHMANAMQLYRSAVYAGVNDPAKGAQLEAAAGEAVKQAKETLVKAAERSGAPEYMLEDIRQGRFTSARSWKDAFVKGLFFGEAGAGDSAFGPWVDTMMRKMVKDAKITPADIEKWAASDSADIEELGLKKADVMAIFHTVANAAMAESIMGGLAKHVDMTTLPPEMRNAMNGLMDGSIMRDQNLTSEETLKRLVAVVRAVDEYASTRQAEMVASGKLQAADATYKSGTLQRVIEEQMQAAQPLENMFLQQGAAGGRSIMALMSYYATLGTDKTAFGDMAVPFDGIPGAAVDRYQRSLRGKMAGTVYGSMAHVRAAALSDAANVGLTPDNEVDRQVIEMAGMNIWAQQMANPSYSTTGIGWLDAIIPSGGELNPFGVGIPQPSAWGKALIMDQNTMAQELTRMGRPDLAAKITGEPSVNQTSLPVFGY